MRLIEADELKRHIYSLYRTQEQTKKLYDLFGGGGAITHCAALSKKYDLIVYNDKADNNFYCYYGVAKMDEEQK